MTASSNLGLQAPPEPPAEPKHDNPVRRRLEKAVLWLHAQADRMDLVPPEFGDGQSVDQSDAVSLVREWIRQTRLWAAYNPEQVLALKAGGVTLGIALLVLVVLVRAIR